MTNQSRENPRSPQALRDLDLSSFVGRRPEDIRAEVTAARGLLQVVQPGEAVFAMFRPNRVMVQVDDDGVIVQTVNG
ncbi:MAG: hypothetical protein JWN95_3389 [Frankiales bacterium]|nr:hypothetical protein [Frankiales bacterium]